MTQYITLEVLRNYKVIQGSSWIQNQNITISFLYNNNQSAIKIQGNDLIVTSKKYLGINLIKGLKELYKENSDTLNLKKKKWRHQKIQSLNSHVLRSAELIL